MYYDPLYMLVLFAGLALTIAAQAWVKISVHRYRDVTTARRLRGAEVAALILQERGVRDVRIEETTGFLSDHYDPRSKTLRLSPEIYNGDSVAAAGIAAHEVGHAVQHADGYAPMKLRQAMVPVVSLGTNLGVILLMIGFAIGALGLAKIGVALFAAFVVFTLVTLPVEIDASRRAKRLLADTGVLSAPELLGVSRVLRAAVATYLASALSAIMQLVYFVTRVRRA
jgi:uncharacterized protein